MVHAFNSNIWEGEAGRWLWVWDQPELHSKFYSERPNLQKQKQTTPPQNNHAVPLLHTRSPFVPFWRWLTFLHLVASIALLKMNWIKVQIHGSKIKVKFGEEKWRIQRELFIRYGMNSAGSVWYRGQGVRSRWNQGVRSRGCPLQHADSRLPRRDRAETLKPSSSQNPDGQYSEHTCITMENRTVLRSHLIVM